MPETESYPPDAQRLSSAVNPVVVEVTRGGVVESRHRGSVAVVDADGELMMECGAADESVYPRSAVKSLQAIALVESGAADAFGLDQRELALACASHGGEPRHVSAVSSWLTRIGVGERALGCGAHWPLHEPAARDLARVASEPAAVHNNCSGKHAGFLTLARHLGAGVDGYTHFEHPVQQLVMATVGEMCGTDLAIAPRAIDGCSVPTYSIPLHRLAAGMAQLASPDAMGSARRTAIERIRAAIAAEPFMVAGTERYCTEVMQVTGAQVMVKTGAEGVFCAAIPSLGFGVALKCDDGASRASEMMMTAVLQRLGALDDESVASLQSRLRVTLRNRNSIAVGEIRPTAALTQLTLRTLTRIS